MFTINHPGSWQSYVNRPDNKGLNIMEVRDKYLREQLLFEQQMNFQIQQQMLSSMAASGGGPIQSINPSENSYVENDYIDDYFE
mgnify:CR=1 FL=1